jgi:hypothetical protein
MQAVQLEVSDPAELSSLQRWLSRVPDARVERAARSPHQ